MVTKLAASRIPRAWSVLSAIALVFLFAAGNTAHAQQQRKAQLSWWDRAPEQKLGHYWIKSDLPAAETRRLARHLNLMYSEYSKRLASLPVRNEELLNVLIFERREDYLLTLRARYGVDGTGSGGMFFVTPSGSGLAFWTEGLPARRIEHVIQHEGFHQFAYSRFGPDLPIWANEGLAEFFGESVVVGTTLVLGQNNPRVLAAVKDAIERNEYVPFEQMLSMTPASWSTAVRNGNASLQYHQAWSMVHFLVYGDGGRYVNAFETYLRHLNVGLPSDEAFRRAFGNDIAAFENRWKQYALAAKPSSFLSAMERIEFLAEGMLELRRRNIFPETLEQVREELRRIEFTHTIEVHGVEVTLKAEDDALFEIPKDDLCKAQPAFTVEKVNAAKLPIRQRVAEQNNPSPPLLGTADLRPRSLRVKWLRNEDNTAFSYEIVVQ